MGEKKSEYDLMPATPSISEGYGEEKKKNGFRKLFSNFTKKKPSDLGKSSSISEAVRFEGEQNGRRSISLFTPANQSDVDLQDFPENDEKQNLVRHNDSVDESSKEEIGANNLEAPEDDKSLLNLMERTEEFSIVQQDSEIDGPEIELPESDPLPEANEEAHGNPTGEDDELQQNESPATQEKEVEVIGCESLAKGLQKICLPWTLTKDD